MLSNEWQKGFKYQTSYTTVPHDLADFARNVYVWEGDGKPIWLRDLNGARFHLCSRSSSDRHTCYCDRLDGKFVRSTLD